MNALMRLLPSGGAGRSFPRLLHTTGVTYNRTRRIRLGLPETFRNEPEMMDAPDYSFLDGRPTPVGLGRAKRIGQQKKFGEKVVTILEQVDYALRRPEIKREQRRQEEEAILSRKLKPKGSMYKPKKSSTEKE